MLDSYNSWQIYVENCATDAKQMPESTLVLARYFQMAAARSDSDDFSPSVTFSPKVHNTRSKKGTLPKQSKASPETPTKSQGGLTALLPDSFEVSSEAEQVSPASEGNQDKPYEPTEDEEIVIQALVNLLSGLIVHRATSNQWTVHRKPFKVRFDYSSFEARVDGYLKDDSEARKVRALIEVKPVRRAQKIDKIVMQEAAQMVAWIKNDPDEDGCLNRPGRRLHVSQDREEIFITFAEYDQGYVSYPDQDNHSDLNKPSPHFLTLHQFVPWNTTIPTQVSDLGRFLLAISLRAQSDMLEEGADTKESKDEQQPVVEDDDEMSVVSSESEYEIMNEGDFEEGDEDHPGESDESYHGEDTRQPE